MKIGILRTALFTTWLALSTPAFAAFQVEFGLPTRITGVAGTSVNLNAAFRNSGDETIIFDQHHTSVFLDRFAPGEPAIEPFEAIDTFTFFELGDPDPRFAGLKLAPGETLQFVFGQVFLPPAFFGQTSTSIAGTSFVFDGNFQQPSFALRRLQVVIGSTTTETGFSFTRAGGVPEPAIWGLMFVGFAAVGAGLRYRRRVTKVRFALN